MKELNRFRQFLAEGQLNKDNYWKLGTVEEKLMREAMALIKGRDIQKPMTLSIPLDLIPEAEEYLTNEYQTFVNNSFIKGEAKLSGEGGINMLMTPTDKLLDEPEDDEIYPDEDQPIYSVKYRDEREGLEVTLYVAANSEGQAENEAAKHMDSAYTDSYKYYNSLKLSEPFGGLEPEEQTAFINDIADFGVDTFM